MRGGQYQDRPLRAATIAGIALGVERSADHDWSFEQTGFRQFSDFSCSIAGNSHGVMGRAIRVAKRREGGGKVIRRVCRGRISQVRQCCSIFPGCGASWIRRLSLLRADLSAIVVLFTVHMLSSSGLKYIFSVPDGAMYLHFYAATDRSLGHDLYPRISVPLEA